jgi:hypothetical protein
LDGRHQAWLDKNLDKQKQYAENHREHDISTKEWNNCLKVFEYKCAYCGISQKEAKKRDGQNLHREHVDNEGYNDLRNGVPACRSCNDTKWTFNMETWFREQSFFNEEKLQKILWWCEEGYKDYIEDKLPYRISKSRIYKEDGTYTYEFELWSVDEKRNMIKCLSTGNTKKDLNTIINKIYKK